MHSHITKELSCDGWFKSHDRWYKQVYYHFFISSSNFIFPCLSFLDFKVIRPCSSMHYYALNNKHLTQGYITASNDTFVQTYFQNLLHYLSKRVYFGQGLLEPNLQALRLDGNPLRRYATLCRSPVWFQLLFNFFESFISFAVVCWHCSLQLPTRKRALT